MEKLLFTGGTGFLGKNVMPLLNQQYEVATCGITLDDMIKVNLAKNVPVLPEKYDVVLHACGKAHVVPKTEAEKQAFFDVNYQGTVNLCDALEKVMIRFIPGEKLIISGSRMLGMHEDIHTTSSHSGKIPIIVSSVIGAITSNIVSKFKYKNQSWCDGKGNQEGLLYEYCWW